MKNKGLLIFVIFLCLGIVGFGIYTSTSKKKGETYDLKVEANEKDNSKWEYNISDKGIISIKEETEKEDNKVNITYTLTALKEGNLELVLRYKNKKDNTISNEKTYKVTVDKDLKIDVEEIFKKVNPITELKDETEFETKIGIKPILLNKDIAVYQLINTDKNPIGEIRYSDESTYRVSKTSSDISGVYGGKKESKENIESITVEYYTMEDINYAIWKNGEYSYAYITKNTNDNYKEEVTSLVK
jgi:predicted secreted protein